MNSILESFVKIDVLCEILEHWSRGNRVEKYSSSLSSLQVFQAELCTCAPTPPCTLQGTTAQSGCEVKFYKVSRGCGIWTWCTLTGRWTLYWHRRPRPCNPKSGSGRTPAAGCRPESSSPSRSNGSEAQRASPFSSPAPPWLWHKQSTVITEGASQNEEKKQQNGTNNAWVKLYSDK